MDHERTQFERSRDRRNDRARGGYRDDGDRREQRSFDRGSSEDQDPYAWREPRTGRSDGYDADLRRRQPGNERDRNGLERFGDAISDAFGGDGPRAGSHRGHGPKGYKRSDARIEEDVHEKLTDDAQLDARGIQVEVQNGEITLNGTVPSRDAKHRAEVLAERCAGVDHVQNNLRVRLSGATDMNATGAPVGGSAYGEQAGRPDGKGDGRAA